MEFRFEGAEVFIRRDPGQAMRILVAKAADLQDGLFELYADGDVPRDFMGPADREAASQEPDRDPFAGWEE